MKLLYVASSSRNLPFNAPELARAQEIPWTAMKNWAEVVAALLIPEPLVVVCEIGDPRELERFRRLWDWAQSFRNPQSLRFLLLVASKNFQLESISSEVDRLLWPFPTRNLSFKINLLQKVTLGKRPGDCLPWSLVNHSGKVFLQGQSAAKGSWLKSEGGPRTSVRWRWVSLEVGAERSSVQWLLDSSVEPKYSPSDNLWQVDGGEFSLLCARGEEILFRNCSSGRIESNSLESQNSRSLEEIVAIAQSSQLKDIDQENLKTEIDSKSSLQMKMLDQKVMERGAHSVLSPQGISPFSSMAQGEPEKQSMKGSFRSVSSENESTPTCEPGEIRVSGTFSDGASVSLGSDQRFFSHTSLPSASSASGSFEATEENVGQFHETKGTVASEKISTSTSVPPQGSSPPQPSFQHGEKVGKMVEPVSGGKDSPPLAEDRKSSSTTQLLSDEPSLRMGSGFGGGGGGFQKKSAPGIARDETVANKQGKHSPHSAHREEKGPIEELAETPSLPHSSDKKDRENELPRIDSKRNILEGTEEASTSNEHEARNEFELENESKDKLQAIEEGVPHVQLVNPRREREEAKENNKKDYIQGEDYGSKLTRASTFFQSEVSTPRPQKDASLKEPMKAHEKERKTAEKTNELPNKGNVSRFTVVIESKDLDDRNSSWYLCGSYRVYLSPEQVYRGIKEWKDLLPLWAYSGDLSPEYIERPSAWKFYDRGPLRFDSAEKLPEDLAKALKEMMEKSQSKVNQETVAPKEKGILWRIRTKILKK